MFVKYGIVLVLLRNCGNTNKNNNVFYIALKSINSEKNVTNTSMELYLLSQQIKGINKNIRSLEEQLNRSEVSGGYLR